MSAKDSCNWRLEAAIISEILHLFGQGNLTFIREKSGILKTDVCGNHVSAIAYNTVNIKTRLSFVGCPTILQER